MVQGKPGVSSAALAEELRGVMRQLRRLSPSEEDDFSCNDVAQFSEVVGGFFGKVTAGGWAYCRPKFNCRRIWSGQYYVCDRS